VYGLYSDSSVLLQESIVYNRPGVYYNTGHGIPAFNRDLAFVHIFTISALTTIPVAVVAFSGCLGGAAIKRSLVQLLARALSSQLGQLSLSSLQGR